MEYIQLSGDIKMPIIGFGTWDLRGEQCVKCVKDAISIGYRKIDTAQMYGNEKEIGIALKQSGVDRAQLFITTKLYRPSNCYAKAKNDILKSLSDLQLDYVDLMLVHEPYPFARDVYRAIFDAYKQGKVRALGISNFHQRFFQDFIKDCEILPMVNQVEAHVFFQQEELMNLLMDKGVVMEAWSPLATGKNNLFNNPLLVKIGSIHGKTPAQIALKYLIQRGIAVIPKSANVNRMKENIDIFDFSLNPDEMNEIKSLDSGESLFGWYSE